MQSGMSKVQVSSSLLNTKEAAQLLRVSEASIRRWSDSGLLAARRVGRRRERRFERPELERFAARVRFGDHAAGRPDHPVVDVADEAAAFGGRNERRWSDEAAVAVDEADELVGTPMSTDQVSGHAEILRLRLGGRSNCTPNF